MNGSARGKDPGAGKAVLNAGRRVERSFRTGKGCSNYRSKKGRESTGQCKREKVI